MQIKTTPEMSAPLETYSFTLDYSDLSRGAASLSP